jgi:hypothetical protein
MVDDDPGGPMSELTPEEFTPLVLIAAAPPNRVGEVVARLVGEHITIGPIAVGPGGMGSATAWGTRGQVTEEVDAGGSELRQATISEVQRTRSVLDATVRCTRARIRLRDWVIPEDTKLILSIRLVHESDDSFPDAASFNPDRFVGGVPKPMAWIPFGGGVNRCVGAAFANTEVDVTLRILLRELRFAPTDAPDERRRWRGVHERWFTGEPPRRPLVVTLHRWPTTAAHKATWHTRRCD